MKNPIQIAILAFILIFAASCGNNETVEVEETLYCHTELVPAPLETSVVADEWVVRTGQSISGLVKDHQKKFPGYTREMFLADNPEIASRPHFTKLDPCDSSKVKYTSIPVHAGDVVYMRHPNQIDTIPGNESSVVWKAGSGRLRHIIDMDDEARLIVHDNPFVCDEGDDSEGSPVLPPNGGDGDKPVDSGDSSRFSNFFGDVPNWFWLLLVLAFLCWFIYYQHRKTREAVNGHTSKESTETRGLVLNQHKETRKTIADESKADRDLLERRLDAQNALMKEQLDAERASREKEQAQFFKLLNQQGKGPRKPGQSN